MVRLKNLLIIGAGLAGEMIISDLTKTARHQYRIVGLIDDNPKKHGQSLRGFPVLGDRYDISGICERFAVEEIFLAIPSLCPQDKADILQLCNETTCVIKSLPRLSEILDTKNLKSSVRKVQIEDLLAREPVLLNNAGIRSYIQDQVVLVTGGGGSIGSELCRQVAVYHPSKIVLFDIYENNVYTLQNQLCARFPALDIQVEIGSVRDKNRIDKVIKGHKPSIIFHAAAHKHVPLMESNPAEAVINNIFGTFHTAFCAKKHGAKKFILISTDKAVNPTNIMGATKRICEMLVQHLGRQSKTEFAAVRFGNVLGSNGSVVPLFEEQIKNGGPITLTHPDVERFFMTIPEAARLVLEAASYASNGEIYVLDMGKPVRIYDLAVNMIRLSGLQPETDIPIKITGLRPGEKLYEEIFLDEEELSPTANKQIFIVRPLAFDYPLMELRLRKLYFAAKMQNDIAIRRSLSEIVPTYHPFSGKKQQIAHLPPIGQMALEKESRQISAEQL